MDLDSPTSLDSFRPSTNTNSNKTSLNKISPTRKNVNESQPDSALAKRTSNTKEPLKNDRRPSVTVTKVKKEASASQSKTRTSASVDTKSNSNQSQRSNTNAIRVTKVIRAAPISTKSSMNTSSLSARHNTNVDKNVTVTKLPRASTQTS